MAKCNVQPIMNRCGVDKHKTWALPCVTSKSPWLEGEGGGHGNWKEGLNVTAGLSGYLHMWLKANYTVKGITAKCMRSRPEEAEVAFLTVLMFSFFTYKIIPTHGNKIQLIRT